MPRTGPLFSILGIVVVVLAPFAVFQQPWPLFEVSTDELRVRLQLWIALLCVQAGAWVLGLRFVWAVATRIREYGGHAARQVWWISAAAIAVLAVGLVPLSTAGAVAYNLGPIATHYPPAWTYKYFIRFGVLAGCAALPAILLLARSLSKRLQGASTIDQVERFAAAHRDLDGLMLLGAVTLGLNTAATGALRSAALAAGAAFPADNVVLWGLFYTAILSGFYVPAKAEFSRHGRRIKSLIAAAPASDRRSDVAQWFQEEERIDQMLRLRLTDWWSISGQLGALAPVIIGWLAGL